MATHTISPLARARTISPSNAPRGRVWGALAARSARFVAVFVGVFVAGLARTAHAGVCYQQPFGNADLADGWHSTCCGRTNPHQGVDYPQPAGTGIPAVADGTIAKNGYSGCLGNYLVIAHPDGMFSGYAHLVSPGPLGVGTPVSRGEVVGYVGNTGTCSQGNHLHFTMADSVEGYGNGNNIDPYAWIEGHKVCNQAPTGSLDEASCETVRGWAFDPDAGGGAIAAHVYYGAPAPTGHGQALVADQQRDDLCAVVGSCNHGYTTLAPLSLMDGTPHEVHVYGIDSSGGANPELGNSPRTLTCATPAITGVKRWISNPTVLATWRFDGFFDQLPIAKTTVDAVPDGAPLPDEPTLVKQADKASVYLVDGKTKRPITSPAVMTAWRFAWDKVQTKPAAEIDALVTGSALRARPTMVADSKGRLLIVDDAEPAKVPGAGGSSGAAGSAGTTGGAGKGAVAGQGGSAAGSGQSSAGAAGKSGAGGTGSTTGGTGTTSTPPRAPAGASGGGGERTSRSLDEATVVPDDTGSCALSGDSAGGGRWLALGFGLLALRWARKNRTRIDER
jgi:hypothetical protein